MSAILRSRYSQALIAAVTIFALNQIIFFTILALIDVDVRSACAWDCGWYGSIVNSGYHTEGVRHDRIDAANWAFFPLFPMLATGLKQALSVQPGLALILTSKALFLLSIIAFILFAQAYDARINTWLAAAVAGLQPYSAYANLGYTEPLFLILASLSLLALRKQKYLAAGTAAGFLTATRFVGGAAGFSFLVVLLARWRSHPDERLRMVAGISLVPLGLATFALFLHHHVGDGLAFMHVQVAWDREIGNPFERLLQMFRGGYRTIVGLNVILAFAAMIWLARTGRISLLVFSLAATFVPLSTGMDSMPRYVWWQPPLLFVLAHFMNRIQDIRIRLAILFLFTLVWGYMTFDFFNKNNWVT